MVYVFRFTGTIKGSLGHSREFVGIVNVESSEGPDKEGKPPVSVSDEGWRKALPFYETHEHLSCSITVDK